MFHLRFRAESPVSLRASDVILIAGNDLKCALWLDEHVRPGDIEAARR